MNLLIALTFPFAALADSLAESDRPPARPALHMPVCLRADNINDRDPETALREVMKNHSDEEVFARLVFAETLASTCPSRAVAKGIAQVIRNRMEAKDPRFGMGREVIFKKAQFRSTTGSCDVAQRAAFLCPTGNSNFERFWQLSVAAGRKSQDSANHPLKGVHN